MFQNNSYQPIFDLFKSYWKSDWCTLFLIFFFVLLSSVSSIAGPYLFSRVIDQLSADDAVKELAWAIAQYAALLGLSSALQRVVQYLSFMSAENLAYITGTRFFEKILKKTPSFFIEYNPAEIQNAVARARTALTTLLQIISVVLLPGGLQIFLTIITLGALLNFDVALLVGAYGITTILITFFANRKTRRYLELAMDSGQANARFVGNAINAMETLRHFGSQNWMSGRFQSKAHEIRCYWRKYVLRRMVFIGISGFILALQVFITIFILIPQYQSGHLSIGDLVLFNSLLLQLNMPFEMIANSIDDIARSRTALGPFIRMWNAPEELALSHQTEFEPVEGKIVFDQVGYTYDNGRGVKGLNFSVTRGAITFLLGETGSGKSTVFKLGLKSIEPQSGKIVVDDVALSSISQKDWQMAVAVVPQEVVLLNESIAENILLGRRRNHQRLRDAAKKAAILPFIEKLPEGFETYVGERGLKLSGGERQRIAIARALYGDPSILFLDEASSALDEETERDIMVHIRALSSQVTVLAITHRLGIIEPDDRLIKLSG